MAGDARWEVWETRDGARHVAPIDDLQEHHVHDCWCNPVDDDGVIVHNSMDRREEFEPDGVKRRKMS